MSLNPSLTRWRRFSSHWWRDLIKVPRRSITNAKWYLQRARRGWADCDAWSLDTYIAKICVGGITQIRDNEIGHPATLCEGCLEGKHPHECVGMEEWRKILDQLIEGFKFYCDDDDYSFQKEQERNEQTLALFAKWFGSLWD